MVRIRGYLKGRGSEAQTQGRTSCGSLRGGVVRHSLRKASRGTWGGLEVQVKVHEFVSE